MSGGVCEGDCSAESLHTRLKRQLDSLGSPQTPALQAGPSAALWRKLSSTPPRKRASTKSDVSHTTVGSAGKRCCHLESERTMTERALTD